MIEDYTKTKESQQDRIKREQSAPEQIEFACHLLRFAGKGCGIGDRIATDAELVEFNNPKARLEELETYRLSLVQIMHCVPNITIPAHWRCELYDDVIRHLDSWRDYWRRQVQEKRMGK